MEYIASQGWSLQDSRIYQNDEDYLTAMFWVETPNLTRSVTARVTGDHRHSMIYGVMYEELLEIGKVRLPLNNVRVIHRRKRQCLTSSSH